MLLLVDSDKSHISIIIPRTATKKKTIQRNILKNIINKSRWNKKIVQVTPGRQEERNKGKRTRETNIKLIIKWLTQA